MGQYIQATLQSGEQVLVEARYSVLSALPHFLLGGVFGLLGIPILFLPRGGDILGLILILLGLLIAGYPFLIRQATELALTNKRLISKSGVLSRNSVELKLDKIESVKVKQGVIERMLGYGTVIVTGTGASNEVFQNIENPLAFRVGFDRALERLAAAAVQPAFVPAQPFDPDTTFWDGLADKTDPDALEEYLVRHPTGRFAELAKRRLERANGA